MKNFKFKTVLLFCTLGLVACAGDPARVAMHQNIHKYTGDSSKAVTLEASDLLEIKGGLIVQNGRAYFAGIDGRLTVDKLPKGTPETLKVEAGKRKLTLRYYDGTNVQCQVNFDVNLVAGNTYKAVLESEGNRANIKIALRDMSSNSLIEPLTLAGRVQEGLNFPRILPLNTPAQFVKTGCY